MLKYGVNAVATLLKYKSQLCSPKEEKKKEGKHRAAAAEDAAERSSPCWDTHLSDRGGGGGLF